MATEDQVRRALLKLKPGKAADAGGWTAEAIWAVARLPRCRPLMAEWLTRVGTSEQARPARLQLLRTHRVVALEKPGRSTRPILIGTIWAKVLSHLLLREARPALQPHMEHRQFGVGTPQGGLMMLHHIQAHLRENPNHVIMQLDFRNAFGTLKREACIAQLAATLGGMPAWLGVTSHCPYATSSGG